MLQIAFANVAAVSAASWSAAATDFGNKRLHCSVVNALQSSVEVDGSFVDVAPASIAMSCTAVNSCVCVYDRVDLESRHDTTCAPVGSSVASFSRQARVDRHFDTAAPPCTTHSGERRICGRLKWYLNQPMNSLGAMRLCLNHRHDAKTRVNCPLDVTAKTCAQSASEREREVGRRMAPNFAKVRLMRPEQGIADDGLHF